MLKVIIADDEAPARKKMKRLLEKIGGVEIISIAENGLEALEQIEKFKPDLAFLDIEMPGLSGIDVAQSLKQKDLPHIVFATAFNEHAIRAFELNALDYLLKPFNEDRLKQTLEKVKNKLDNDIPKQEQSKKIEALSEDEGENLPFSGKLPVPIHDRYILVNFSEILLIEVKNRNTILYSSEKSYVLNFPLDYYEKKLPGTTFFRANRSALLNLQQIKEILIWFGNRFKIILNNDEEVICSRDKSKILKQVLKF